MYFSLDGKKIKADWQKLHKEAQATFGDDEGATTKNETLVCSETNEQDTSNTEFNNGALSVSESNEYGYFNITIDVDDELAFEIIEYMRKKGEKIKRLVQLAD